VALVPPSEKKKALRLKVGFIYTYNLFVPLVENLTEVPLSKNYLKYALASTVAVI